VYILQYSGQGSGPIWFDDLRCSGVESSLAECKHTGLTEDLSQSSDSNCNHNQDVSILCGNREFIWHCQSPVYVMLILESMSIYIAHYRTVPIVHSMH